MTRFAFPVHLRSLFELVRKRRSSCSLINPVGRSDPYMRQGDGRRRGEGKAVGLIPTRRKGIREGSDAAGHGTRAARTNVLGSPVNIDVGSVVQCVRSNRVVAVVARANELNAKENRDREKRRTSDAEKRNRRRGYEEKIRIAATSGRRT
ncbi:hypothetical protein K438DRAFT_1756071 [Mycena galopus ATCC 62051]|nr:hypothetical protein K438DRAFT_1756071 [Mycena galopus ATCC 62051]